MKLHPALICMALGVGLITVPTVFAHDGVGEVIRDSVELPLVLPGMILRSLAEPRERVIVVEHEPEYYQHYWHHPYVHRHEPYPYGYPGRAYPDRGPWGRH